MQTVINLLLHLPRKKVQVESSSFPAKPAIDAFLIYGSRFVMPNCNCCYVTTRGEGPSFGKPTVDWGHADFGTAWGSGVLIACSKTRGCTVYSQRALGFVAATQSQGYTLSLLVSHNFQSYLMRISLSTTILQLQVLGFAINTSMNHFTDESSRTSNFSMNWRTELKSFWATQYHE